MHTIYYLSALLLSSYTTSDVTSGRVLGATSQEVIASYPKCDIQKANKSEALLCQVKLAGQRAGVSFILGRDQRVQAVAGVFAVENEMASALSYLKKFLDQLTTVSQVVKEENTPTGKVWGLVNKDGTVCEVTLKKTNVCQWSVNFVMMNSMTSFKSPN